MKILFNFHAVFSISIKSFFQCITHKKIIYVIKDEIIKIVLLREFAVKLLYEKVELKVI